MYPSGEKVVRIDIIHYMFRTYDVIGADTLEAYLSRVVLQNNSIRKQYTVPLYSRYCILIVRFLDTSTKFTAEKILWAQVLVS